jgi:CTP:molybdopterin cytidylyltransferase MocA
MAPNLGLAVLAAGLSRRFGPDDKLMALLEGRPLCDHIAQTASALDVSPKLAICAPDSAAAAIFAVRGFEIVENPRPDDGLSGSVKLAARYAVDAGLDGLVICLADMPFVPLAHLTRLRDRWLYAGRPPAIASRASGSGGWVTPPAIFSAAAFPELLTMSGDTGARALLSNAETVELAAGKLADFDTLDDFRRAETT